MSLAIIVIVIVVIQSAFANKTMLVERTHVDNSCYEFNPQSCSGVCSQFFSLWCSCDEYCQVYGRCCYDYQTVCKEESEKARRDHENLMNATTECDIDISHNNVPQQIITSCSAQNVSVKTAELCEAEPKSSALVSKVMSRRTQLHYKNRYCMLCNGEEEDDIVYWSTMVGTTNRRFRIIDVNDILEFFENSVKILPPDNSREITCFPNFIMSCINNTVSENKHLCEQNALSPIKYKGRVYKNTYCLQCSGVLQDGICTPADRTDVLLQDDKNIPFSLIFNWERNMESSVFIDSKRSEIRNVSCLIDTNNNLKGCKINQCSGTQPVVNGSCQLGPDHYGCIEHIFKINFTVPENSTGTALKHISTKLVEFVDRLESDHNVTRYYSQNVELRNITIVNDQIQGLICLQRMAYNLCYLSFRRLYFDHYYKYLDSNLVFNMNGSISTCRYKVTCDTACADRSATPTCYSHIKYFSQNMGNNETESDIASTATRVSMISRICILFIIVSLEVMNIY